MPTRLHQVTIYIIVAATLLSACSVRQAPPAATFTAAPTATPQPSPSPTARATHTPEPTPTLQPARFIPAACPFQMPAGLSEGQNLACGYLSVPANRSNPAAGSLQLAVAVIHPPDGPTHDDAVVYLEGGPGSSALEFLYLRYASLYAPVLQSGRDLILFDQRGVGLSRPALDCPEQDRLTLELLDNEINGRKLTGLEANQLMVQAMQVCAQNWAARADLTGFTTQENAADVADLARVLGGGQVNLWGISYGTRLALEVMRSHPEVVRSAILDSNLPPDVDPYASQPENLARAFDLLFESCAKDEACNSAYPNLRQVFFDTAKKLDQENATVTTANPLTGQSYTVALSGDRLTELVFKLLYDREVIPLLPRIIYNASQGDFHLLERLAGTIIAAEPGISDLMHFALQCAEEIGQTSPETVRKAADKLPDFREYFDDGLIQLSFDICKATGFAVSADLNVSQAVESEIPSLVMAGEFDPVTPPEWSEQVAASLSSSYLYEYPAIGHGVSVQPGCPRQMMLAFLDDPAHKPEASCLDEMPPVKFDVPATGEVSLETFVLETMGMQGVRPAGWNEVKPGVFSRRNSALDATLVLVQSTQATAEVFLQNLAPQFGLSQMPSSHSERTANSLDWKLYTTTVRGMKIDFAVAQSGDMTFLVMLQSSADERDGLYSSVFLPMIDSIKPIQ